MTRARWRRRLYSLRYTCLSPESGRHYDCVDTRMETIIWLLIGLCSTVGGVFVALVLRGGIR